MDERTLKEIVTTARKEALARGHVIRLTTTGRSMLPFLKDNDSVEVVYAKERDLAIGDLILFTPKHANAFVAHRLVYRKIGPHPDRLVTKGDASFRCDIPITYEQVIGRIVRIRKPSCSIGLEGPGARLFSYVLLFFSMTRTIFAVLWLLRKLRCVMTGSRSRTC